MEEQEEYGIRHIFHTLGTIASWILSIFLYFLVLIFGFNLGGFIVLVAAVLAMPIKPIKALWNKMKIPKLLRVPILVILFVVALIVWPTEEEVEKVDNTNVSVEEMQDVTNTSEDMDISKTEVSDTENETKNEKLEEMEVEEELKTDMLEVSETKEIGSDEVPEASQIETLDVESETEDNIVNESDEADNENTLDETAEEALSDESEEEISNEPEEVPVGITYVANTNSMKFHEVGCSSAKIISPENRKDITATREEMISRGYDPCKRCNP